MDSELQEIREKKLKELKERAKAKVENIQESVKPEPKIEPSSSPIQLNSNNFKEFIEEKPIAFVEFFADWCSPCKMIAPILEKLASEYSGKVWVGKVDVDQNKELAMDYGATSIPTFWAFKEGEAVSRFTGAKSRDVFENIFKRLVNLDMDEFREKHNKNL